jgi:hypothetical protein
MFKLSGGMVLTIAVGWVLCGSGHTAQARCPGKDDVLQSKSVRERAGVGITLVATSYQTTIFPTRASGTSGCGKSRSALREEEATHFVAWSGTGLLHEMAQGGGQRVASLAALLGCDPAEQPAFAHLVQSQFAQIVPSERTPPAELVTNLTRHLRADSVTARSCPIL